ncbi:GNAT family N-acetyltransferase [Streptomyces alfalfae]
MLRIPHVLRDDLADPRLCQGRRPAVSAVRAVIDWALLAEQDGRVVGLLTYTLSDAGLEIVSLDAVVRHSGVGSFLLAVAAETAQRAGARRFRLVTTNDNLDALCFYQRRGLRITDVTPGAVDAARVVKPSIPLSSEYSIPLHDELTLELPL